MICPNCATQLLQPANFCPVCGASLPAAADPGAAAPPPPAPVEAQPDNVVYLPQQPVQPNPHAGDYGAPATPEDPTVAVPATPAQFALGEPTTAYTNVLGEPVDEATWRSMQQFVERDDVAHPQRDLVALLLVASAAAFLTVAIGFYIGALRVGAGGGVAGGFVLLSTICWIGYLQLPESRQLRGVSRWWQSVSYGIDRRMQPLHERASAELQLRRERERFAAMRAERARRVAELGERAYREFRGAGLGEALTPQAQRVVAIEQQMLLQDSRLHELQRGRGDAAGGAGPGAGEGAQLHSALPEPPRRRGRRRRRHGSAAPRD